MRVLIVDDEPCILSTTAALMRDMDFDVATCGEAAKIREAIERVEPDVLLQDVRMPGLDLERLMRELRADPHWKRLPIVLFTASIDFEEVGGSLGVPHVLPKPFHPRELAKIVEEARGATVRA